MTKKPIHTQATPTDLPDVTVGADMNGLLEELARWRKRIRRLDQAQADRRDARRFEVLRKVVYASNKEAIDLILDCVFKKDWERTMDDLLRHAWTTDNTAVMAHLLPKTAKEPPRGYLICAAIDGKIKMLETLAPHYSLETIVTAFLQCVASDEIHPEGFLFFYNKTPRKFILNIQKNIEYQLLKQPEGHEVLGQKPGYQMLLARLRAESDHEALTTITESAQKTGTRRKKGLL